MDNRLGDFFQETSPSVYENLRRFFFVASGTVDNPVFNGLSVGVPAPLCGHVGTLTTQGGDQ